MRAAISLLMLASVSLAAACNRQPAQQNEDVAISNVPPSNQLVNGNDNPDVNESTSNGD